MKKGDLVRLTQKGIERYGYLFRDEIYENLEVKYMTDNDARVWEHNKRTTWWVTEGCFELMDTPKVDPSTWKRNTPIWIKRSRGDDVPRHFSHIDDDGKINYFEGGLTSFSTKRTFYVTIDSIRLATKEELK